ncbi:recombinase RecT [Herbaspirillum seropedicae]|uniref:recombinase RecT n=1 Tax=Herbaspirillum seropedicae TaxID=964 RepID=UPI003FCC71D9
MTTSTDIAVAQETAVAEVPQISASTGSLVMDTAGMDRIYALAETMAAGRATVPKHLQNNAADCMAVVMQAVQWGMNPYVVAQKTHLVNGTLGYEAQLVNAVVQSSGAIVGRFHYEYRGEGNKLECRVGAVIAGEQDITWNEWLCMDAITTKNSPLWKTNPKQQMGYLQVKNWARAYKPGAILGVYTSDELYDMPATAGRHMGNADVIAPPADLLQEANAAADQGVAAYQQFFQNISKDSRKALAGEHDALKKKAMAADAARTVENAPAAQQQTDAVDVNFVADMDKAEAAQQAGDDGQYVPQ